MWPLAEWLVLGLCPDLVAGSRSDSGGLHGDVHPQEPVVFLRIADRLEPWLGRQQWLDRREEQWMEAWISFLRYCGGFARR